MSTGPVPRPPRHSGSDSTRVGCSGAKSQAQECGPGTLIGDNPFDLENSGAVGAVWIRSVVDETGTIVLRAFTPELGNQTALLSSVWAGQDSPSKGSLHAH